MGTADAWKALAYIQQIARCHIQDVRSINFHALKNLSLTRFFLFHTAVYQLRATIVQLSQ